VIRAADALHLCRAPRVRTTIRPPRCAALALPHMAFARAIIARYRGRRGAARPLDRAFRRISAPTPFICHNMRNDIRLGNVRVDVRLQRQLRIRQAPRPLLAWRRTSGVAPVPGALPKPGLIEPIFARERRVESTISICSIIERQSSARRVSYSPAPTTAKAAVKPVPAVPMIVRHLPPPAPAEQQTVPHPPNRRTPDEWSDAPLRARAQAKAAPIPLTPAELNHITEHVVGAIDRRFVAHRERHGRI
jgi:hypothetical protein